jgi:hypothetical protein
VNLRAEENLQASVCGKGSFRGFNANNDILKEENTDFSVYFILRKKLILLSKETIIAKARANQNLS